MPIDHTCSSLRCYPCSSSPRLTTDGRDDNSSFHPGSQVSSPPARQPSSVGTMAMMASSQTGSAAHSMTGGGSEGAERNHADNASSIDGLVSEKAPPQEQLTAGQKVRRHCMKYWWVHLIAVIVLLAILLPITFTLIVPAIVQAIVSGQSLPVITGGIYPITSESALLSLRTLVDVKIPAYLGPLKLNLYNADTPVFSPFVNLTLPGERIYHQTELVVNNQTVEVQNGTELVKWFNEVFDNEEVQLSVKADPHVDVSLSSLHYTPHLQKTLTLPGLNYLKGIHTTALKILIPPAADGHNLEGTLMIPNAGVLTLGLGDTSFNLKSGDVNLGIITLYDLAVKPGNNSHDFSGKLYLNELIPNLGPILHEQGPYLDRGVIGLNATGNQTLRNGAHVKYFEEVLNAKHIPLEVGVISLVADLIQALLNGNGKSITQALGEITGNQTLVDMVLSNFNKTQAGMSLASNGTQMMLSRRKTDATTSLMWNMLRLSMKSKRRDDVFDDFLRR